jgi:signal peptidase II
MTLRAKRTLAALVPLLVLALDRLAKWYAFAALPPERGAVLLPGLKYEYFLNSGLVFSLSGPAVALAASLVAFLVFGLLIRREFPKKRAIGPRTLLAAALVAGGGLSNIYDRIMHGGVIDYLLFLRSAWNLADIMILAGVALFLLRKREATGGESGPAA